MCNTPLYPKIGMTIFHQNTPDIIVVAGMCAALERGGISRTEIHRILDEIVAEGFDDILTACGKYINIG